MSRDIDPGVAFERLVGGTANVAPAEAEPLWQPSARIGAGAPILAAEPVAPCGGAERAAKPTFHVCLLIHAGDEMAPPAIRSRWPFRIAMRLIHAKAPFTKAPGRQRQR